MKSDEKHLMISASGESDVQEPPSASCLSAENPASLEEPLQGFQPINQKSLRFLDTFFPGTTLREWNNWQWQLRHSFTSLKELAVFLNLSPDERMVSTDSHINLPVRITPYFASLFYGESAMNPVRRTMVPVVNELILSPGEQPDPLE